MRKTFILLAILLSFSGFPVLAQSSFVLYRDAITEEEFNAIKKDIENDAYNPVIKENIDEAVDEPQHQPFYSHLRKNIKCFFKIMMAIEPAIDSISFNDSTVVLCADYTKGFLREGGYASIYYQLHDIYSSLFSFKEVKQVSLFDCMDDCRNITCLPIAGEEYLTVIENAVFKKSFYIQGMNYYRLLGDEILTNPDSFNDENEIYSQILNVKVREYYKKINK